MSLSKKAIWEQVFPEDAELRIQMAFEMLLGEEFGLTDYNQLGTAIGQSFQKNCRQDNKRPLKKELSD